MCQLVNVNIYYICPSITNQLKNKYEHLKTKTVPRCFMKKLTFTVSVSWFLWKTG